MKNKLLPFSGDTCDPRSAVKLINLIIEINHRYGSTWESGIEYHLWELIYLREF